MTYLVSPGFKIVEIDLYQFIVEIDLSQFIVPNGIFKYSYSFKIQLPTNIIKEIREKHES